MHAPMLEEEFDMDVEKYATKDRMWMLLYPEDHDDFIRDPQGNVGVLVDREQAKEIKRLAEEIIERTG